LRKRGYRHEQIVSQPQLLCMNSRSLQTAYQHHVGVLRSIDPNTYRRTCPPGKQRGDRPGSAPENRRSGRETLLRFLTALAVSNDTFEGNLMFLRSHDLLQPAHKEGGRAYKETLLLSSARNKRKKVAWLLREVLDYRDANDDERKARVAGAYRLVREDPQLVISSIERLDERKEILRRRAQAYGLIKHA